ncbi:MAG: cytochrome C [Desulfuromonadales bacterium]
MKKFFVICSAILFTFAMSGLALAFHDGGVAHCDGCHSMHGGAANGPALQKGSDASSTCLNCHNGAARYHVSSADGSNSNEGGDFHWVKDNSYAYVQRDRLITVDYSNMGHNVIAADFGITADANLTAAPGGSYLAANLSCTSCHDPHGQAQGGTIGGAAPISVSGSYGAVPAAGTIAGNYRILYDSNKVGFSEDAPIARANSYDGASVQYGSGMSGWCANCHGAFYSQSSSNGMHPTDVSVPTVYNSYVATGNYTGTVATAYDPLVPFERGVTTASADLPDPTDALTAGVGVDGSSQVMCLSCHRAHASAFPNALRWDMTEAFIAEGWTSMDGITSGGAAAVLPTAAAKEYYKHGVEVDVAVFDSAGTPFTNGYGHYQRSLCNKCHVQD